MLTHKCFNPLNLLATVKIFCLVYCMGLSLAGYSAAVDTTRTLSLDSARKTYASPHSHFVDLDGVNIHYADEGKGQNILLIHGTLGDLRDWDAWAADLAKDYRVLRFDLPGFGLSGEIKNGNYSVDRMLSTIDALVDHTGLERFAIVGISFGGIVTFRYAATRRDRVSAMVLLNSAGIQAGKKAQITTNRDRVPKKPAKNIISAPSVERSDVEAFYAGYINDPAARSPDFITRKLDMLNIVGRDYVGKQGRALYERGNPQRILGNVKAPSLIIWGQGNRALDTRTAYAFQKALVKACTTEVVTLKNGGHYINVESPKKTLTAARRFLEKNRNRACE